MFSSPIVLPAIAFVLVMVFFRNEKDKVERVNNAFAAAFVTFVLALFLGATIADKVPRASTITEFEKTRIVALSTSATTEGSFFLGSGYIEGRPSYFFYFETPDGGKKLGKLDAHSVTLYEEDRKDAFFAKTKKEKQWDGRGEIFNFFVPSIFRLDEQGYEYVIHIPKGSIKEGIRLNLPK